MVALQKEGGQVGEGDWKWLFTFQPQSPSEPRTCFLKKERHKACRILPPAEDMPSRVKNNLAL